MSEKKSYQSWTISDEFWERIKIEDWRNRPLQGGRYPYVYVDGIYLRRNWGGAFENMAILVAIAVNEDGCQFGYRKVRYRGLKKNENREPRKVCVKENKRHPFSQESEQEINLIERKYYHRYGYIRR